MDACGKDVSHGELARMVRVENRHSVKSRNQKAGTCGSANEPRACTPSQLEEVRDRHGVYCRGYLPCELAGISGQLESAWKNAVYDLLTTYHAQMGARG